MNQVSTIGLGTDITKIAGYAFAANDRLGNIDFVFENTGANTAAIQLKEVVGSGYVNLGSEIQVVAKGTKTVSLVLLSKYLGIFGSGNTTINMSTVMRNQGNLRGAQIDIVPVGRSGFSWDNSFDNKAFGDMHVAGLPL